MIASGNRWRIVSRLTVLVASRKLVRIWTENLLLQLFSVPSQKVREIEIETSCNRYETANISTILERKVDLVVRGREWLSGKFFEAEVGARNGEKRISDIAFQEINQEFESQPFQLHQASRWADQAQGDQISLYGEFQLRSRLFQENHARDCQHIEDLRCICCEEADRGRQARSDELSMQQVRNLRV